MALPSVSRDLGAGMTGVQSVVDGYLLASAALLLSANAPIADAYMATDGRRAINSLVRVGAV